MLVPISQLRPGEKVLATDTKTGKTQPDTISAVLVDGVPVGFSCLNDRPSPEPVADVLFHNDTDLYDLKILLRRVMGPERGGSGA